MTNSEPKRIHIIAWQHLDVAWLWTRVPQGEDIMRQCFERAIEMIEAHPDERFVFARSTAWSFWIVEQRYPELFEKVRKYVAEDRIELCGGEWVEPDHLIPSGEALVRQSALGQWYFQKTFEKTASTCWDPDIFGHPNTFPQIIKKCGMDGFYFHRCRPQDEDGNPLHQFIWEGPDGSRIFVLSGQWALKPEAGVFAAAAEEIERTGLPGALIVCAQKSDRRITMKPDWVKRPREANANQNQYRYQWSKADEILQDMKSYADKLPVVKGELGFIYTGTFTSNGYNKRTNRRLETLLTNAEKASSWASLSGFRYPDGQLTQAWRDLCVNQFHDIACGCSYAEVHEEDRHLFADSQRRAQWALDQSLAFICDRIHAAQHDVEDAFAVFDFIAWPRQKPVLLPKTSETQKSVVTETDESVPSQLVRDENGAEKLLIIHDGEGIGCKTYRLCEDEPRQPSCSVTANDFTLENEFVLVEIDLETGDIRRLYDKIAERECLANNGRGNRFEFLEEDSGYPGSQEHAWEPWYITYTGEILPALPVTEARVVESGPIRAKIRVLRKGKIQPDMAETTIVQDTVLNAHSPIVRFETRGNWQASRVFLKARFDLPFTCETVAAEAPYGVIEREPHCMVPVESYDRDCAPDDRPEPDLYMQKWLDVSDGERGLLFLNNGKYGYDATNEQVGLSLMRAPWMGPVGRAKITGLGPFEFSYGVLPHTGGWRDVGAPRLGYDFNNEPVVRPIESGLNEGVGCQWWDLLPSLPPDFPRQFAKVLTDGVLATVFKQAEDKDGLIVRLVETLGREAEETLSFHQNVESVTECDMLERDSVSAGKKPLLVNDSQVALVFSPFEIKTIRVRFRAG